ncbi:MAG: ATP-dependent helicase, partial [Aggregatilineales bacterium]
MSIDLFSGLNPQQQAAVAAEPGAMLILAGPGSGKTGVLTRRIAYLIRELEVKPWQIMAVTFTNKAAAGMRHRVQGFLGENLKGLQIGTFHATCARILRIEHACTPYSQDFIIYDSDDQVSAVETGMKAMNIDTRKFNPRRVLSAISSAKNELVMPGDYEARDYFEEIVQRVYPRYQAALRDSNALDFDDLLVQMVIAMQKHDTLREKYQARYAHVLVDEFQDTNMTQYRLVELFGKPQNNIFAVGDEDQSIYAFRGADYRNVRRFRVDFPSAKVILLEQNYRSTQIVLDLARAVIDRNQNRTPKALFTDRDGGELVRIYEAADQDDEARYIMGTIDHLRYEEGYDYNDFAIMYRTNVQSRALEKACREYSVPYQLVGGVGFYKRMEIRDLLAYLRLVHNPNDSIAFSRVINTPRRSIGKKSQQNFIAYAANNNLTYGQIFGQLLNNEQTTLTGRAGKAFRDFAKMIENWREEALQNNLLELFDAIMGDTAYMTYIRDYCKTPEEYNDRDENIRELRGLLQQAQEHSISLAEFLAEQTLMTDTTDNQVDTSNAITLLTLHAAKGLEYPVVFVSGIERDLLPHARSKGENGDYDMDSEAVSEERRLFYVGI